ncbi:RING finger 112-like isoform X1 [Pelobates cultripes]|uniref:RING finger 112-like isoform X1 n=1 Tax=Pelobates cultripes TaxID=61616 RepID=A0AAD1SV18_PELCU|nr:RING finger 112-like isoform X1 [Pelobates cultripes]
MGNTNKKQAAMPHDVSTHFHKLEEDITCSICLFELDQPVSITCGHTFCEKCISSYWDNTQLLGSRCPECRMICPRDQLIPVHRLRNLITNVQLVVKEEQARKEYGDGPIQLVFTNSSGKLQLDETAVSSLFLNDNVSNYPACLICVIGEKRRGKSFLMNYILRALRSQQNQPPSLGGHDDALEGFDWKAGTDGVTKGIWIWSRPFIVEKAGEKMAVYVVDTEGSLDLDGDRETSIKLSALSMVLSSYLIFNVNSNLKTTELDYLEIYLYISELTGKSFSLNNLQHLDILVRDWQNFEKCGRGPEINNDYFGTEMREQRKKSFGNGVVIVMEVPRQHNVNLCVKTMWADGDHMYRCQSKMSGSKTRELVNKLNQNKIGISSPMEMAYYFKNQKILEQTVNTLEKFLDEQTSTSPQSFGITPSRRQHVPLSVSLSSSPH